MYLQKQIHLLITFSIILVHLCDTITFGIISLPNYQLLASELASDASASNSNSHCLVSSDVLVIALDWFWLGKTPVLLLGDHLSQAGFVLEERGHIDHERVPDPTLEVCEGPVEGDGGDLAGDDVHVDPGDDGNSLTSGIFSKYRKSLFIKVRLENDKRKIGQLD